MIYNVFGGTLHLAQSINQLGVANSGVDFRFMLQDVSFIFHVHLLQFVT